MHAHTHARTHSFHTYINADRHARPKEKPTASSPVILICYSDWVCCGHQVDRQSLRVKENRGRTKRERKTDKKRNPPPFLTPPAIIGWWHRVFYFPFFANWPPRHWLWHKFFPETRATPCSYSPLTLTGGRLVAMANRNTSKRWCRDHFVSAGWWGGVIKSSKQSWKNHRSYQLVLSAILTRTIQRLSSVSTRGASLIKQGCRGLYVARLYIY